MQKYLLPKQNSADRNSIHTEQKLASDIKLNNKKKKGYILTMLKKATVLYIALRCMFYQQWVDP